MPPARAALARSLAAAPRSGEAVLGASDGTGPMRTRRFCSKVRAAVEICGGAAAGADAGWAKDGAGPRPAARMTAGSIVRDMAVHLFEGGPAR
jgi:hypothetical protein